MRYNLILVFLFLFQCSANINNNFTKIPYNTKGFAYIYNNKDHLNVKNTNKSNLAEFKISQNNLRIGKLIKLINPKTNDTLILKNNSRIKYPDFYKIAISKSVAEKLKIDSEIPLIEILEIRKNKSFVAKKAIIHKEEKKISSKAPVASVKISNISKNKQAQKKKIKKELFILIASFYSEKSANLLKQKIITKIPEFNQKKLIKKKINDKKTQLLSGPYYSVNLIKNDYIKLKKLGFEELDISIYD